MRLTLLPQTQLGKWSIILVLLYVLLFMLSEWVVGPGPDYNKALVIALTSLGTLIAAGASVTGFISIARHSERSILVMLSTVVGVYCLIGNVVSLLGVTQ